MMEHLQNIALYWIVAYAILAGIYGIGALVIARYNDRIEDKKIQKRISKPEIERRDFIQSLRSLAQIALFCVIGFYGQHMGWGVGMLSIELTWINQGIILLVSILLYDTWFYWGHRLIHMKPFYKRIHRWHHIAITPTVWSTNSDTFLDNCVLQSYWLFAALLLPIPYWLLAIHKLLDLVIGLFGHSGYEYSPGRFSRFPMPFAGVTFHDQHHEGFTVNYALHFSFWDRLMGTIDPNYDETMKKYS